MSALIDDDGRPFNLLNWYPETKPDAVRDGRHLMENDGRYTMVGWLDYQLKYGGRPFTPSGIADTIDAAIATTVYQQVTGQEPV